MCKFKLKLRWSRILKFIFFFVELLQIVFFFEDWWAVALNIPKAFDRVWHAGLPHKLRSYRISGKTFDLISSFLSKRRRWVVLDGKSSQEYPVNAGVPQGSILVPALFLLCINDLPDDDVWNIAIYADDTTLYSNVISYLAEMASELESDLSDTVDWGRKWLVDFHAEKT